jgi:hypothetical protein
MTNVTIEKAKLEQWLEDLEYSDSDKNVIADIKQAIAAVQEPVVRWVGLTDEDKEFIELTGGKSDVLLAELVEAKLREKNT